MARRALQRAAGTRGIGLARWTRRRRVAPTSTHDTRPARWGRRRVPHTRGGHGRGHGHLAHRRRGDARAQLHALAPGSEFNQVGRECICGRRGCVRAFSSGDDAAREKRGHPQRVGGAGGGAGAALDAS